MNPSTRAPRRAGASKGLIADRCRRTPRDHTREGRDLPRYYRVLRPPSQPLQRWSSISAPSQNTHASSPRAHRSHTGVLPTGWTVGGGSLTRASGRARPNLGLPSCRFVPDRNSRGRGAGTRALRRLGAPKGPIPDRVRRTRRGRTLAKRADPRYYRVLRPPSQPLQARSAPRGRSALGARAAPRGARECRQHPRGGRGGTWGWPSGQGSTGKMCPPLDCNPSKIARSNLPPLEPFSHRFLPRGSSITCGFPGSRWFNARRSLSQGSPGVDWAALSAMGSMEPALKDVFIDVHRWQRYADASDTRRGWHCENWRMYPPAAQLLRGLQTHASSCLSGSPGRVPLPRPASSLSS